MMDELARDGVGCYGGTGITPNIDALAGKGVRFTNAYTPSPICVPARASFQTGRYVFQNGCWSNAQPYSGKIQGWAHRLRAEGVKTVSIGKLHYRSTEDDNGYEEEILPLHVTNGEGWVHGLLRREDATCFDTSGYARDVGCGEDSYTQYDRNVRDESVAWLKRQGESETDQPWALFVSFLRPHYPLTCPKDALGLYNPDNLPPIRFDGAKAEYRHPAIRAARSYHDFDDHFRDEEARNLARACYFGLCSYVDGMVGQVLAQLDASGLAENTIIILTSDHGDMNGHRGFWTKMVMYEDAIGIPLIIAGPGLPNGKTCETQASLIDIYPTALQACGISPTSEETGLPAHSLMDLATQETNEERVVYSEYHDGGSITGFSMIRDQRWKYVHYAGFPPQLFDLESDPFERIDFGLSAEHAEIRSRLLARMCNEFDDPDAINERCFSEQAKRIAELGGISGIQSRMNYDHTPVKA